MASGGVLDVVQCKQYLLYQHDDPPTAGHMGIIKTYDSVEKLLLAGRWATVSLDFIMGLPKAARDNDATLTIVDSLSKMAHLVPTQTTVTAEGVAELLADRLIWYHGVPENFVSDSDPTFVAELLVSTRSMQPTASVLLAMTYVGLTGYRVRSNLNARH
ncbi:hypothetical protein Efla_002278 [Eimeria flavescens]